MSKAIEDFGRTCRSILKEDDNGPRARSKVASLLEERLKDATLMDEIFNDATPGRELLYEDAQLGFCILAHNHTSAKASSPHDHGPSWAIYGQVRGETEMWDWELVAAPDGDTPGKVKRKRTYQLTPGKAHVYNEGDLHSPSRSGPVRLIRIEGTNMQKIKRAKYAAA